MLDEQHAHRLRQLPPKFLSFEGAEGVGKTTAIDGLCRVFEQAGVPYVRTREPGGSEVGELLRGIFLDPKHSLSAETELLMLFAARNDHLNQRILPALAAGQWVICDRFLDSTVAYQGFGRYHGDVDKLKKITLLADNFVQKLPDVSFWLDLPIEVGMARAKARSEADRMEKEAVAFFERVYEGFLRQHEASPERLKRIDATGESEAVLGRILATLLM